MTAAFDRDGVAVLRARVDAAATELRQLRSHDPATRRAMAAVRLTAQTLALWWLPTLDALLDE